MAWLSRPLGGPGRPAYLVSAAVLLSAALALAGCEAGASAPAASATETAAPVGVAPGASAASGSLTGQVQSTKPAVSPAVTAPWPSYHADDSRTGAVSAGAIVGHVKKSWSASLGGAVYGQPVVANGEVIAATENDRVSALNASTGRTIWTRALGTPLKDVDAVAGCGDIQPLGITSTPVVDPRLGEVFVVEEATNWGGVHHRLIGLSVKTGKVLLSEFVDPPLPKDQSAAQLLQRTSLAVANGRVYIGYGGNAGDCGNYHGWLIGVNETGAAHEVSFMATPGSAGGAIWQGGGAPAVDGAGDLYISTGNSNPWPGSPTDPGRYAESVVKLSPTLRVLASFKDTSANHDADLGTGDPVLLTGGRVYAVGKTDVGYVLGESKLAKSFSVSGVCGSDPDGGSAYNAAKQLIFTPCRGGGIQEIDVAHRRLVRVLNGPNSGPIIVGNQLWALSYNAGVLSEFNANTGAFEQSIALGPVPTFASPSAYGGRLFVGTLSGVVAVS